MANRQLSDRSGFNRGLIIIADLVMIIIAFFAIERRLLPGDWNIELLCWALAYVISIIIIVPMTQDRLVKAVHIIGRSLVTALMMTTLYVAEVSVFTQYRLNLIELLITFLAAALPIIVSRSVCRLVIKTLRKHGQDNRNVIMIGASNSLRALYDRMGNDISVGYTLIGYFNDERVDELDEVLEYKGRFAEVYPFLESNNIDMVFCNLDGISEEDSKQFMDYCENNLIHFYSVPTLPNYCQRRMNVEFVYEIPIMSIRKEPLASHFNRFVKRAFDIVFSFLFIITCFWWIYLIVALITKITMPGPVLFKQQRNGLYGNTFTCLKFRSMKVNADADKVQATRNDPRKTKWGNILRKTSIDELPQFINVLKGDMSIIGPRPHMLKHTEEYRKLVDKYMVRHYAKPGITGWAQVTGSRGETSELWMMEERIKKDIWYVENWSILLDIIIIIKTILNALGKEEGNAY